MKNNDNFLPALEFVLCAQDKKASFPYQSHSVIKDGRIIAFNGVVAASCPFPLDDELYPNTHYFYEALKANNKDITITKLKNKLKIKSDKMVNMVPCLEDDSCFPNIDFDLSVTNIDGKLLKQCFKTLFKIIDNTGNETLTTTLLLQNCTALATHNKTLIAEYWHGVNFGTNRFVLPVEFVKAVNGIDKNIMAYGWSNDLFLIEFDDHSFIQTKLINEDWPSSITFNSIISQDQALNTVNPELFPAIKKLSKFTDDFFYTDQGLISSTWDCEEGTTINIDNIEFDQGFAIDNFLLVDGLVKNCLFKNDNKFYFNGEHIRGVIIGIVND